MSGALIQLVSKGAQDMYTTSDDGHSFFRMKFTRHTNFSQAPKFIKVVSTEDTSIVIPVLGDIINGIWLESNANKRGNIASNLFYNSTLDLFIGGQKVDSHPYDYYADIWPNYLAETANKAQELNNRASQINFTFVPLHFFFCDHGGFLPLVALQNHQVEIRIDFDDTQPIAETDKEAMVYGNYIYLDTSEREALINRQMDFVITQVQRIEAPLETVVDNLIDTVGGYNVVDLSQFNHPVSSLFWGFGTLKALYTIDKFTFRTADIHLNGTPLFENMSPMYFHTIQNYYKSSYGVSDFVVDVQTPFKTRYYAYHFGLNASNYTPSGTCNFSRLDNAKLIIRGAEKGIDSIDLGPGRPDNQPLYVYAVNYNVLRIKNGLAGILFGN